GRGGGGPDRLDRHAVDETAVEHRSAVATIEGGDRGRARGVEDQVRDLLGSRAAPDAHDLGPESGSAAEPVVDARAEEGLAMVGDEAREDAESRAAPARQSPPTDPDARAAP